MKSNDNEILQLLSNNDVTFFIPPYQRNYEWDTQMCEAFYRDIRKVAQSHDIKHFFGTVIYYAEQSQILGEPSKYILVDGQQRLTTTMLFLIAARDVIEDASLKNTIDVKYLRNNNVSGDDVEYKIKLKQVESDWSAYKKLVLEEPLTETEKKSIVFSNYSFFKSKLEKLEQSEINSLIINGLVNFNIVTIQLEPERNKWEKPQEIFESMNSLGKPLSLADLVRNYLLLGKSASKQNVLYHNYWLRIEKNLVGDNDSFSVSSFIRDYMQLEAAACYKKATETNYKELYRNFKDLFADVDAEELIQKLALYSENYSVLAGYKSSGNDRIDKKIADLKIVEASGFYSFILGILNLYTDKKLTSEDCLSILDSIFVYITRRRILRLTQAENKNAPQLVKYFDKLIESADKKDKMLSILSDQQYALRLPNDNEISSYLLGVDANFYNLRICKFIFTLIEENITKSRPINDMNLQIEHIMPQTLNEGWKNMLGQEYQRIYDGYVNNIGNLTLIRHNQELGNKSFSYKKDVYINNSGMQISKNYIIDQNVWSEDQIKGRASYLINLLVDKIIPVSEKLKTSNNYSIEKKQGSSRFSFAEVDLIGKTITYFDDAMIQAEVIGDKEVRFEGEIWHLSPLTREIETRKNRRTKSGAYWGIDKWTYQGKTLETLMRELTEDE
ncbi:MAG: DUF262 domain-containing protein [Alphaproteobacteria bacterium]|nr:DUF262 domain-containing protein [Alphaproteobacteria bacterium]